ncbi:hypothetical protein L6R52_26555 [Myxococcota bacterium]|nr:hypothetical protein [Myxococcota bacterium]
MATVAAGAVASGCVAPELRERYAAVVDAFEPTPAVDPSSPATDPDRALGPPDGRTVAIGLGGSITLRFFREIPDGPGPDLRIYEVGPDGAAARVAVSTDGLTYAELAELASGETTAWDLGSVGVDGARFVWIRGVDELGLEAGFDLDAVEALQ